MKTDLTKAVILPSGVEAKREGTLLHISGPQGMISRNFFHPRVGMQIEQGKIVLQVKKATKREKRVLSTFTSHVRNMVQGAQERYVYTLKICSGHFPMSVAVAGQEFVVKNFLGEIVPRKVMLPAGVQVKIEGTEVVVQSPDKELAGKTAACIEHLCVIKGRDIRVFMDGIWITHKAGKSVNA